MRLNARIRVILSQGAIVVRAVRAVRETPCLEARLGWRKSGAIPWHSRWLSAQTQRFASVDRP
jgi:hypothetical protein